MASDPQMREDPLAPARGILFGALLGLLLWGVLGLVAWIVLALVRS